MSLSLSKSFHPPNNRLQLAANHARLPVRTINAFALSYIASRAAWTFVYYTQDGPNTAAARSATYLVGLVGNMWLLIRTGYELYSLA